MRQRSGPIEVVVTVAGDPDEENASSTDTPKSRYSYLATGNVVERIVDLGNSPPRSERVVSDDTIDFWCDDSVGVEVGDRVKVIQEDDGEFVLFWAEC